MGNVYCAANVEYMLYFKVCIAYLTYFILYIRLASTEEIAIYDIQTFIVHQSIIKIDSHWAKGAARIIKFLWELIEEGFLSLRSLNCLKMYIFIPTIKKYLQSFLIFWRHVIFTCWINFFPLTSSCYLCSVTHPQHYFASAICIFDSRR